MQLKQLVKPVLTLIIRFFDLLPLKKNKIIFSSFSARNFTDNPKYIAEEILKRNIDVDCVFVLDHEPVDTLPSGIRIVRYNTLRYLYELATAKFWIDNTRKQDFVVKRKGQIYIQTWHGALPLKKIEKDISGILSNKYIKTAKNDSKMIDYLLTSSEFGENILKDSFWYEGKILITGSPRLDILFQNNIQLKEKIRNELSLDNGVKYILYAPTFRDDGNTDVYKIDFDKIIEKFSHRFGGKWKVIFRLHPNIREKYIFLNENIIDASYYPDITNLYLIADCLITDYSSTMFDYALTGKPVFLYAPDSETYFSIRHSYFDLEDLPFELCKSIEELENRILNFNINTYKKNVNLFFNKINLLEDGHASERVVNLILKIMEE